jgi:pyruvate dehydrogenase E2 component (dihydrolipoamide acetyltransferase)
VTAARDVEPCPTPEPQDEAGEFTVSIAPNVGGLSSVIETPSPSSEATAPDDFELLEEGTPVPSTTSQGPRPKAQGPRPSVPEPRLLPITPVRRIIADRALASARDVPQFPLWIDVDAGPFLEAAGGDAVRATAAWALAVAKALAGHPRLNASYMPEGIRLHGEIHVGIAVPLEDGIVVPVLHNADRRPLDDLATELRDLEARARNRGLRGAHLAGATFTLADWSRFGVRGGVPLIHPPQVAALSIGSPRDVPTVREGGILFRPTAEVVLVSDQRALDAGHAAAFLVALKSEVERAFGRSGVQDRRPTTDDRPPNV